MSSIYTPKIFKWDKHHKTPPKIRANKVTKVEFGLYGMQSLQGGVIFSNQLDAARKTIAKAIKGKGLLFTRIFPQLAYTNKGHASRMGKGIGKREKVGAVVSPGTVIFEITLPNQSAAASIMKSASYKLNVKTTLIKRENRKNN